MSTPCSLPLNVANLSFPSFVRSTFSQRSTQERWDISCTCQSVSLSSLYSKPICCTIPRVMNTVAIVILFDYSLLSHPHSFFNRLCVEQVDHPIPHTSLKSSNILSRSRSFSTIEAYPSTKFPARKSAGRVCVLHLAIAMAALRPLRITLLSFKCATRAS